MAAISRIVSLPSATQYNPTDFPHPSFTYATDIPFLTAFTWGQVAYGGTPTNTVEWIPPFSHNDSYPEYFFKNKQTSQYRFKLYRTSDNAIIKDGLLSLYGNVTSPTQEITTDLGSGLVAGTEYLLATYTLANGTTSQLSKDVFGNSWEFRAMTAPQSSPALENSGFSSSGYAKDYQGNSVSFNLLTHTTNWGGASSIEADQERYYDVDLLRSNGSVAFSAILYLDNNPIADQQQDDAAYVTTPPPTDVRGRWPSATIGYATPGAEQYEIWVKARTLAGSAARVEHPNFVNTGPTQLFVVSRPRATTPIFPNSGLGLGGYTITINGYYLDDVSDVKIGGLTAQILTANQTYNQIQIIAPANTTPSGYKNVVLTGPGGTQTLVDAFFYTTTAPPYFGPFFPYFGPPIY